MPGHCEDADALRINACVARQRCQRHAGRRGDSCGRPQRNSTLALMINAGVLRMRCGSIAHNAGTMPRHCGSMPTVARQRCLRHAVHSPHRPHCVSMIVAAGTHKRCPYDRCRTLNGDVCIAARPGVLASSPLRVLASSPRTENQATLNVGSGSR